MKIIIDCRETKLYKNIFEILSGKDTNILLETENLLIGDVIIRNDTGKDIIIIERKSIDDLLSSIKDGRYKEQSHRLNSLENNNHNIIYLIEGIINITNKQIVYSSIFSLNYYKGFSVYRSLGIDETAYIIYNMVIKLQKEKDKGPYHDNNNKIETENKMENDNISYSSFVKKKKSDNITPENFGEIVLTQIPGISDKTAVIIMKEFKTINNLIEKVKENPDVLSKLTYENDKKQSRKLNKTCIQNIMKFLINTV